MVIRLILTPERTCMMAMAERAVTKVTSLKVITAASRKPNGFRSISRVAAKNPTGITKPRSSA